MNQSPILIASIVICAAALAGCSGTESSKQPVTSPAKEAWFNVDPNSASAVTGKALYEGRKPVRKPVGMDEEPQCARLHQSPVIDDSLVVNAEGALANVFVHITRGLEGKKFEPPTDATAPVVIDQKGCWFSPRVTGMRAGQRLKVTNSDPLTHNIHPMAEVNRDWNQSQSPGADPLIRRFTQPEVMIRVKCNIHSWMRSWIGVVDHPYFAVTGADGGFQLRDLPPGNYTIEAWQEQLGAQEQQVTLPPSGKIDIVFRFK
jgi:plastocyanin